MNLLTSEQMRSLLRDLDRVKALTEQLRVSNYSVPVDALYAAVGAEARMRSVIVHACVASVAVEAEVVA